MIKIVHEETLADKCDILLTKLIRDEKQYNDLINEEIEIKDYFKNMITNDNHMLLCYEVNNEVVGYIFFKYIENDDGKGYLIDGLYVEEQYRNKGIAKELIQFGLNESKKKNVDFIDIKVMYQNKIAIKLYESFGFNILSLQMRKK